MSRLAAVSDFDGRPSATAILSVLASSRAAPTCLPAFARDRRRGSQVHPGRWRLQRRSACGDAQCSIEERDRILPKRLSRHRFASRRGGDCAVAPSASTVGADAVRGHAPSVEAPATARRHDGGGLTEKHAPVCSAPTRVCRSGSALFPLLRRMSGRSASQHGLRSKDRRRHEP